MSEGIDYAEMLEIPVSTVNVVKKKSRRLRDLKSMAVGRVNERMEENSRGRDRTYAGNDFIDESTHDVEAAETSIDGEAAVYDYDTEKGVTVYEEAPKRTHPVLIAEFAVACALCLAVFLTNVFITDSAINTFIRTVLNPDVDSTKISKTYSDFNLTSVVSEYAEVETTLSSAGLLSFQAACSVYPACDGTVASVTKSGDAYTVVVAHSDTFESVYTGLTTVYYEQNDAVRSNVPFAYTDGTSAVQVSFYQDGTMLNCYSVDAQNCLSWNK